MTLNAQQQAFVDHDPTQSARVLAGPGTGKSYAAVQFLERLAKERPGLRVRMLTFTRAATAEFAAKMDDADLTGLGVARPATVHSFALSTLLRIGHSALPTPLRIPDSWEVKNLVRPHLAARLKAHGHRKATPKVIKRLEEEMAAGWESLDPDAELFVNTNPALGAAYVGLWREHRLIFGYSLLAELPFAAGQVLEDHGTASVGLDLLLVDEYQDLNEADIKMIRLIHEGGVAVVALGDDDQSIYGYRLAAPEGIRRFLEEFGAEHDYPLSESRRCGRLILNAARTLIDAQSGRPLKPPLVPTPGAPDGAYAYLRFRDEREELEGVAQIIGDRVSNGIEPSEILVLTRSVAGRWADWLKPHLEALGIQVAWTGWVEAALGEAEVRRWITLAHLKLDREDSLAWWTLLELTSGVGERFINYVYDHTEGGETFGRALLRLREQGYPDRPRGRRRAEQAIAVAKAAIEDMDLDTAVLDGRGWGGWLLDRMTLDQVSEEARHLFEMVGEAVAADEGLGGLLSQLETIGKDLAANEGSGVRVMTMTGSKGLTVNTVIVMGVEEGIIPRDESDADPGEERRLLYVAMTRATDMCVLTYAQRRSGPSARIGTTNVGGTRNRSPLLATLPGGVGDAQIGSAWVARLLAE